MTEYNPTIKYEWNPEAEITISGQDFNILYNSLAKFMASDFSPMSIMRTIDAFGISQKILVDMVSKGIATPLPQEENSKQV
jgi:hypothetical protein